MKTFINNYKSSVSPDELRSVFFTEKSLNKILRMTGCQGIRFHLAKDDSGALKIFAEPTDNVGHPLPADATRSIMDDGEGQFFMFDEECPKDCPPDNGN
jgi:hypothetical protein